MADANKEVQAALDAIKTVVGGRPLSEEDKQAFREQLQIIAEKRPGLLDSSLPDHDFADYPSLKGNLKANITAALAMRGRSGASDLYLLHKVEGNPPPEHPAALEGDTTGLREVYGAFWQINQRLKHIYTLAPRSDAASPEKAATQVAGPGAGDGKTPPADPPNFVVTNGQTEVDKHPGKPTFDNARPAANAATPTTKEGADFPDDDHRGAQVSERMTGFAKGKADIPSDYDAELAKTADAIANDLAASVDGSSKQYYVVGGVSPEGNKESNEKLALARAQAVTDRLKTLVGERLNKKGVHVDLDNVFVAHGYSPKEKVTGDEDAYKLQRRAQVFEYKPAAAPAVKPAAAAAAKDSTPVATAAAPVANNSPTNLPTTASGQAAAGARIALAADSPPASNPPPADTAGKPPAAAQTSSAETGAVGVFQGGVGLVPAL